MKEIYSTSDLWLGSLFMSEAKAKMVGVHSTGEARPTIVFSFCGEDLSWLAKKYCQGQAQANVSRLRLQLNALRDLIFQARKQQEGRK